MADISDLMNMQGASGPDPQSLMSMAAPLAAKGEELLKSGQVSLAQAKAAQKKLGLDPETVSSAFQKAIGGGQTPPPSDAFNSVLLGQQPAPQNAPPKISGTKNQNTVVKNTDQKSARNSYADPEQAKGIMDTIRDTDEAKAQREGISKMEQMLAMNQAHQQPNDAWIKPLLAYGDSLNGTNQAASFEPQAAKRQEAMLKFANDIQQRKGDYAKSIEDALAKLKTGSDTNALNQRITDLQMATSGNGLNGRGGAYLLSQVGRAGKDIDNQLKSTTNSVESLNRGEQQLSDTSVPLSYNRYMTSQLDIAKALAGSGNPTDAKAALEIQQLLAGGISQFAQKMSGKFDPERDDIRKVAPTEVAQTLAGLKKIREDYRAQAHRDFAQVKATYDPLRGMVPGMGEMLDAKEQLLNARHPLPTGYSETGAFQQPSRWISNGKEKVEVKPGADFDKILAHAQAEDKNFKEAK